MSGPVAETTQQVTQPEQAQEVVRSITMDQLDRAMASPEGQAALDTLFRIFGGGDAYDAYNPGTGDSKEPALRAVNEALQELADTVKNVRPLTQA